VSREAERAEVDRIAARPAAPVPGRAYASSPHVTSVMTVAVTGHATPHTAGGGGAGHAPGPFGSIITPDGGEAA